MWSYFTPKSEQRSKSPLPPLITPKQISNEHDQNYNNNNNIIDNNSSDNSSEQQDQDEIDLFKASSISNFTVTESPHDGRSILQFEAHFILFKDNTYFNNIYDYNNKDINNINTDKQINGKIIKNDFIHQTSQNNDNDINNKQYLNKPRNEDQRQSIIHSNSDSDTVDYKRDNQDDNNNDDDDDDNDNNSNEMVSGLLCITCPRNSNDSPISVLPRMMIYLIDSKLIPLPFWSRSMVKAIAKSMDDLTENDLFNILIVDGENINIYDKENTLCQADEISKRQAREWLMVDCSNSVLTKYAERYSVCLQNDQKMEDVEILNETDFASAIDVCYEMLNMEIKYDDDNNNNNDYEQGHDPSRYLPLITLFTSSSLKKESEIINKIHINHNENKIKPRIFTIGIGEIVNRYWLNKISTETRGQSLYICNETIIEKEIKKFLSSLRFCTLYDISVEIENTEITQIYPSNICDIFYPSPTFIRLTMSKKDLNNNPLIRINGYNCDWQKLEMVVDAGQFITNRCKFPLNLLFLKSELFYAISQCWYFNQIDDKKQFSFWLNKTNKISDKYQLHTPWQPMVCLDIPSHANKENIKNFKSIMNISSLSTYIGFDAILKEWIQQKQMFLDSKHNNLNIVSCALNNVNGCISINKQIFGIYSKFFIGSGGNNFHPHFSKMYDEVELHKIYEKYYKKYDKKCCVSCVLL